MAKTDESTAYVVPRVDIIPIIIIVFISIAYYNVLELIVLALGTFKRYRGLYFWSVLIATMGIGFNGTGYLLKHLSLTPIANLYATVILIGWCTMISGQSLVLYSRLHLVLQNPKILRAVLIMILFNATWLHIPIIILVYGSNSPNQKAYLPAYSIYEKLQLTVFFVQEAIISGLYIWSTSKLLKLRKSMGNRRTRRVMNHLIYVNVLVVLLDITILVLEYTNKYDIQTAWKPLVYSVKLKMEFSILNRLLDFMQGSGKGFSSNPTPLRSLPSDTTDKKPLSPGRSRDFDFDFGYSATVEASTTIQNRFENVVDLERSHADGVPSGDSKMMMATETSVHTAGAD